MERIITITINDKIARNLSSLSYVCGNSDYTVNFEFDEEWNEYEVKTARFVNADRKYQDVVFSGNKCPVPVIMDTMYIYVGVYAGNLKTTTPAHINARKSILSAEGTPEAPSDDVYAQIMEILNQTGKDAIDAAKAAKSDADMAKAEAEAAKTAADAASNYASAAEASAKKAAEMIQDDDVLEDKAWSSRNIVDRLCSPFNDGGSIVTCYPVEDYPLHIVSHIEPIQLGSGTPSPENVRSISGWDAVKLKINDNEFIADFGETVYGGTYDWETGVLTAEWFMCILTGTEAFADYGGRMFLYLRDYPYAESNYGGICSHGDYVPSHIPSVFAAFNGTSPASGKYVALHGTHSAFDSTETLKEYLAEQYAAGTPVQVCYKFAVPYTIQLEPQQIKALSGENIVYSDTGDTSVSGRLDPIHEIATLKNAVAAMGGTV